jgi:hypothetical protein
MTTKPKTTEPQSATITLRASGAMLRLVALRKPDASVVTYVTTTTTDADKRSARGMTERHPTMDAAKKTLLALASKAEKLGWTRTAPGRAFAAKPDAFSALPAAPKPAVKK